MKLNSCLFLCWFFQSPLNFKAPGKHSTIILGNWIAETQGFQVSSWSKLTATCFPGTDFFDSTWQFAILFQIGQHSWWPLRSRPWVFALLSCWRWNQGANTNPRLNERRSTLKGTIKHRKYIWTNHWFSENTLVFRGVERKSVSI